MDWLINNGKRVLRITSGVVLVVVGLFLALPGVPGPGLVVVFIGLSLLAVDFVWAHRLKTKMEHHTKRIVKKIRGKPDS